MKKLFTIAITLLALAGHAATPTTASTNVWTGLNGFLNTGNTYYGTFLGRLSADGGIIVSDGAGNISGIQQLSATLMFGTFSGGGSLLTNLNASALASGKVPLAQSQTNLPAASVGTLTLTNPIVSLGSVSVVNLNPALSTITLDANANPMGMTITITTTAATQQGNTNYCFIQLPNSGRTNSIHPMWGPGNMTNLSAAGLIRFVPTFWNSNTVYIGSQGTAPSGSTTYQHVLGILP